jgi:FkbM family methyltransferase
MVGAAPVSPSGLVIADGAGSPFARRTLAYRGRSLTVVGLAEDHYLRTVGIGGETDDFLAFIFARAVRPGATVLDVGANIGVTAVMAATACEGTVFAFEPGPRVYPCLLETLKANPGLNILPVRAALGAEAGEISFFDDPGTPASSHMVTGDTYVRTSDHSVKVMTIDQFVSETGLTELDLIKIDVEGFEIDVLRGAVATIAALRPAVFVEFNAFTMITFRNINPREMLVFLRETFPYLYRFIDGRPILLDTEGKALTFLHDNIVRQGCLDDLYGAFRPL